MKLGSEQHKKQYCENLIKIYHENFWQDELNVLLLNKDQAAKHAELKVITQKIANKGYSTKNEGEKAKFVAERELLDINKSLRATFNKLETWPQRIKQVQEYLDN